LEYKAQKIMDIKKDITRYLIISCDIKIIKKIEGDISLYLHNFYTAASNAAHAASIASRRTCGKFLGFPP
jgi:hypothetical protein